MQSNYPIALADVLGEEGGYVNNPHDPGGATYKGVTARIYDAWRYLHHLPKRDVRLMTLAEMSDIYRRQYANAIQFDGLPSGLDACLLDGAVNSGPTQAIKWLQQALGERPDGHLGFVTFGAIAKHNPVDLINAVCDERVAFLKPLHAFPDFGHGWLARVKRVRARACAMSLAAPKPQPAAQIKPQPEGVTMTDPAVSSAAAAVASALELQTSADMPGTLLTAARAAKPWYASQTIWGGIAVIGASLGGGYNAWQAHDMAGMSAALTAGMGGVAAIVGRFKASTSIGKAA
ncbi:MAG: hypothetical protein KGQ46_12375 [Hyphomicrobiales bacterium]|nr:hypothetical protein [Hyphomicrobiales bacterium]MDE2113844.1 glycoside hydrolase family 108 protein [Hyphomicrobiales bacterium]